MDDRFLRATGRTFQGFDCPRGAQKFRFVQLADPQLGMMPAMKKAQWMRAFRAIGPLTGGCVDHRSLVPIPLDLQPQMSEDDAYEAEKDMARRAVDHVNKMEPRPVFCVVCGDLVHAFPDKAPEAHAKQVGDFKDIFSGVHEDIALVCLCGNHDVGERPSAATVDLWKGRFGDDYFSFFVNSIKFIVINSQLYKNDTNCKELAKEQDTWLSQELHEANANPNVHGTIVFSHIPPFIYDPEEPSGYFPLEKNVRLSLLGRMARAGVTHIFCGHYHRNAIGKFELRDCDDSEDAPPKCIEVVTTAAVGGNLTNDDAGDALGLSGMAGVIVDPALSGFRVVDVDVDGKVSHEFRPFSDSSVFDHARALEFNENAAKL